MAGSKLIFRRTYCQTDRQTDRLSHWQTDNSYFLSVFSEWRRRKIYIGLFGDFVRDLKPVSPSKFSSHAVRVLSEVPESTKPTAFWGKNEKKGVKNFWKTEMGLTRGSRCRLNGVVPPAIPEEMHFSWCVTRCPTPPARLRNDFNLRLLVQNSGFNVLHTVHHNLHKKNPYLKLSKQTPLLRNYFKPQKCNVDPNLFLKIY